MKKKPKIKWKKKEERAKSEKDIENSEEQKPLIQKKSDEKDSKNISSQTCIDVNQRVQDSHLHENSELDQNKDFINKLAKGYLETKSDQIIQSDEINESVVYEIPQRKEKFGVKRI